VRSQAAAGSFSGETLDSIYSTADSAVGGSPFLGHALKFQVIAGFQAGTQEGRKGKRRTWRVPMLRLPDFLSSKFIHHPVIPRCVNGLEKLPRNGLRKFPTFVALENSPLQRP
jgi:hypothetical protein